MRILPPAPPAGSAVLGGSQARSSIAAVWIEQIWLRLAAHIARRGPALCRGLSQRTEDDEHIGAGLDPDGQTRLGAAMESTTVLTWCESDLAQSQGTRI